LLQPLNVEAAEWTAKIGSRTQKEEDRTHIAGASFLAIENCSCRAKGVGAEQPRRGRCKELSNKDLGLIAGEPPYPDWPIPELHNSAHSMQYLLPGSYQRFLSNPGQLWYAGCDPAIGGSMRRFLSVCFLPLFTFLGFAQTASAPQTARQALIEMFFGTAPNHLEKHLPDTTRNAFKKMTGPNGVSAIDEVSMFATMARAGGGKFETFDTGPVLLSVEDPRENQKVEITVEGDNLSGDEDQIEVALHVTKDEKEQVLPFVPRLTFVMKTEADVWRLSEISLTLRVPLEDPDFLKSIEQEHNKQSEAIAQGNVRMIIGAEERYHASHGLYACSLSDLGKAKRDATGDKSAGFPLLSNDLAAGKSDGYVFAISGCDGSQYKVVAEPATPDSGQRAFCSDESGGMRSSTDGKATTCLSAGETVEGPQATGMMAVGLGSSPSTGTVEVRSEGRPPQQPATSANRPQRVRISQGVSQAMIESKVSPTYPPEARAARVQGSVILKAIIGKDGTVQNLSLISGDPLLASAAMDAVRQWKYRPYLLNGNPVKVDTQITVNFTLSGVAPSQ
jgi:TonB family protein